MTTPLLQFTISNLEDLEEQFFTLWMKACKVLKAYNARNGTAEMEHIVSYCHSTEYNEMMRACLLKLPISDLNKSTYYLPIKSI